MVAVDLIIFVALLIAGAFIVHWILKKVLSVVLWAIAIFIAYILLKLFVL
ncbi:TPA: hypothetical protein H1005_02505 [archaeon]|nr:hypothetical protein [Candidatus Naiadarchaeales archaeon SRR2090153.bin1042]